MFSILAHFRPLDPATNERVDVYVSSAPGAAYSGLGGIEWEPAFADGGRPTGSIELMTPDLGPGIQIASAKVIITLSGIRNVNAATLYWQGATAVIYRADDLVWPAPVEFDGYVVNGSPDLSANVVRLDMQVRADAIDRDLLTATFSGDGAAGGEPAVLGTLKPAGFGHCLNIPPVFFDSIRNIAMIDGYGNTISIDWLGEGLSSFGAAHANYASYAALAAAIDAGTIAPGQWATCIAEGMIALGAPPAGVITVHAHFGHGMTGDLMKHLIVVHAGVDSSLVNADSFDDLDTDVPFPIHFWAADQISVKSMVEALALGCNATPLVTFQGMYAVTRPFGGDQVAVFRRPGYNEPAITDWKTNDSFNPYWQMKMRVARPIRVLSNDEVNYEDKLVPRGLFNIATVYRQGEIVWLANQSQWLYINQSAEAGHAPPDPGAGDAWWENTVPAPDAGDLTYIDGTPIDTLQPEEPAAQVSRSIDIAESAITFVQDASGTLVAGQVPYTVRGTVSAANVDVTLTASWSISASTGITASIDNGVGSPTRGQVTITAVTQSGTITVVAMSGNVVLTKTVSITVVGQLANLSTVDTAHILNGAVSNSASVQSASTFVGDGTTTLATTLTFNLVLPVAASVSIILTASHNYANITGSKPWKLAVSLDGSILNFADGSGYGTDSPSTSATAVGVAAGSHTIDVTWYGHTSITLQRQNMTVLAFKK